MWELLGFTDSPYDARPLGPRTEDVELLVGREHESIDFITNIESSPEGILIISGSPGVGKTSFFNTQQYLLESGESEFGPRIMCARSLSSVRPEDTARELALRILYSLHKSVVEYCGLSKTKLPSQIKTIGKWLSTKPKASYELGLQVLGCGGNFARSVTLPSVQEVTFEGIQDAIECISSDVVNSLGLPGVFCVIDNIENLEDEALASMLMSFRDTLFAVPRVWWILIGQSGLSSLIQTLDPRVSERLTGSGIELKPISVEELYLAVEKRVHKFHRTPEGKAPLSENIHRHLYESSRGEIRFIFKYCNTICINFVRDIRRQVQKGDASIPVSAISRSIGSYMIKNQINESMANEILKAIIRTEINGIQLRPKDKKVLQLIHEKTHARPKDFKDFGFKSIQDFYSNYLSKLYSQNLLVREQEGKAVKYRLRGLPALAAEFRYFN